MELTIEQLPGMRLAYLRHTGSYTDHDGIHQAWLDIFAWEDENHIPGTIPGKPPVPVGLSHDNPHIVPPKSCRYDASIHVADSVTEDDGMPIQEIPAGSYACHIHVGDFRKIGETLFKMFGQIEVDGISVRDGAVLEFHLDQPGEASPDKLRTKLCIPVK